mmetsp:Transcript_18142/g.42902  ORF Transcript_18142/g.42902 Transcript_18142/m.42902 type:complete len:276 (+) Transcript_18142:597-1424(+)
MLADFFLVAAATVEASFVFFERAVVGPARGVEEVAPFTSAAAAAVVPVLSPLPSISSSMLTKPPLLSSSSPSPSPPSPPSARLMRSRVSAALTLDRGKVPPSRMMVLVARLVAGATAADITWTSPVDSEVVAVAVAAAAASFVLLPDFLVAAARMESERVLLRPSLAGAATPGSETSPVDFLSPTWEIPRTWTSWPPPSPIVSSKVDVPTEDMLKFKEDPPKESSTCGGEPSSSSSSSTASMLALLSWAPLEEWDRWMMSLPMATNSFAVWSMVR